MAEKELPPRMEWDPDKNLLETELGNGWMVVEWFEMQDQRRVVARLMICPAPLPLVNGVREGRHLGDPPRDAPPPSGGVTARLLRTVKVGKNAEPVIEHYREWVEEMFGEDARREFDEHTPLSSAGRRTRGKQRPTDLYYAELAREYAKLCEQQIRNPIATIANGRDMPVQRISSHVHLARRNGFLTAPWDHPGLAGGELTPRAEALLAEAGKKKSQKAAPRKSKKGRK